MTENTDQTRDDILRNMLNTPPEPHPKKKKEKKTKTKKKPAK